MNILRRTLAALVVVASASAARADSFTFNFSGGGQSASGTLTANPTATAGQFLITSLSGTLTGVTISGLLAPGVFGGNDNLLFSSTGTYIPDGAGFSFSLVNGVQANVFTFQSPPFSGQQFLSRSDGTLAQMTTFSITPTAIPEPSSIVLLGTGLAGVADVVRRRRLFTS